MVDYKVDILHNVQKDISDWRYTLDSQARQIFTVCDKVLSSLETEIKIAEQQYAMLNNELILVDKAIKINNDTRAKARNSIASANQQISSLKSSLSSIDGQISSAESSSDKSKLQSQKSDIKNQISDLKDSIANLEHKIAKVGENNAKLETIKGKIREEMQKCYDHKQELTSEESEMKSVYNSFRNYLCPQVMGAIDSSIVPKMEETIEKGLKLSRGLIRLGGNEGPFNCYTAHVCVDSSSSFANMANKMQKSMDELRNYVNRCSNSTYSFSHNLRDRVSANASEIVNNTTSNIENISNGYFYNTISNMREAYSLCKEYESITVDVCI